MRRVVLQQGEKIVWETAPGRTTLRFICITGEEEPQMWETLLPETVPLEDLRYITAHSILPALHGQGGTERLLALACVLDLETLAHSKFVTQQMARYGQDRFYPSIADYIMRVKVVTEDGPLAF